MSNVVYDLIRKISLYKPDKIVRFIVADIVAGVYLRPIRKSFSQKGEDMLLDKLLSGYKGIYVDIGANDPHRFSNTKRFYLRGWNGINIEPNPVNYKRFCTDRASDTNINCGIGGSNLAMTFYVMFPDTLSTFSKKTRDTLISQGYVNEKKIKIPIVPLSTVLDKYGKNKKIAFFSIDTEGFDYNVLRSNNWKKFRPRLICIEANSPYVPTERGEYRADRQVEKFLRKQGYILVAHTQINNIYADTHVL